MGGESWKCPLCSVWKLTRPQMRNHLKSKHDYKGEIRWYSPNVQIFDGPHDAMNDEYIVPASASHGPR